MIVVFSKRAMTALLVETREKITVETGGVFLGKFFGDVWYVVETVDPGPNSVFSPTYFEYDQDYINHLINKVSRLYKNQLDLIGLWHRHPGSLDTFSMTDDGTNTNYAKLADEGAISGLVNIDPEFRLTMYHVSLPLKYEKIQYIVNDEIIPDKIKDLKSPDEFASLLGGIQSKLKSKKSASFSDIFRKAKRQNVNKAIHDYLKSRTISNVKSMNTKGYKGELPIESILECLESDLEYFENNSIDYSVVIGEDGLLNLSIKEQNDNLNMSFGMDGDVLVFTYNEITYKYLAGLFQKAIREKDRRSIK